MKICYYCWQTAQNKPTWNLSKNSSVMLPVDSQSDALGKLNLFSILRFIDFNLDDDLSGTRQYWIDDDVSEPIATG